MPELTKGVVADRSRDRVFRGLAKVLARLLVPVAVVVRPGRARYTACQWALAARFPAEDLRGLCPATRQAFLAARAEAFWRDGELIGVTSGHRDAAAQHRMFSAEVWRTGSVSVARQRVLPAQESRHVAGTALDVRPVQGAWWLERNGPRYGLYRTYDNEWWHFEYWPGAAPPRLRHPGGSFAGRTR